MSNDFREQFLAMVGSAPPNGQVTPQQVHGTHEQGPQPQPPGNDRLDRIEQALERLSAPPTVASIVNARPNPNPSSDGGSPGFTRTIDSDEQPVWKWSQSHVDRFIKEKGYREFASVMKRRLPNDLRGAYFKF